MTARPLKLPVLTHLSLNTETQSTVILLTFYFRVSEFKFDKVIHTGHGLAHESMYLDLSLLKVWNVPIEHETEMSLLNDNYKTM